jgi:hypothetical protein
MILQRIKNDDDEQWSVPAGAAPAQGGAGLQVVFFSRQGFSLNNFWRQTCQLRDALVSRQIFKVKKCRQTHHIYPIFPAITKSKLLMYGAE